MALKNYNTIMVTCPHCSTEQTLIFWPETNTLWTCVNDVCKTRFTLNDNNEPIVVWQEVYEDAAKTLAEGVFPERLLDL